MASIQVPESLLREARRRGLDVEGIVIRAISRALGLDPLAEARAHLELAERLFREALVLVEERDAVQASEKLYKAAEETLKAAALVLDAKDILERVEARGRWTVTDLERVARLLDRRVRGREPGGALLTTYTSGVFTRLS